MINLDWKIFAFAGVVLVVILGLWRWSEALKETGRVEVRQAWAEAQRKADLNHLALVAIQQQKINNADQALIAVNSAHDAETVELRAALDEERTNNEQQPKNNCVVPPMPDRVRNALNAIGRTKH